MTYTIWNEGRYIGSATKPKPRSPNTYWTVTYNGKFGGSTFGTVADMKRLVRQWYPKATFKRRG